MGSSVVSQPDHVRGRLAPSPTGLVHLGNARTALVTWLSVRRQNGALVWRLEDLDPPREMEGAADAAMRDLRWLGLDWDEGPDVGGPFGPYLQSQRYEMYEHALRRLAAANRLFPCSLSRRDINEIASAPHGAIATPAYPQELRPTSLAADWFEQFAHEENPEAALRFIVDDQPVEFDDSVFGRIRDDVASTVGDFVLKRKDGLFAYQLAVVVDDLAMDVTEVVRGVDLLDSSGRQIQLIEALGGRRPTYAHIPLVLNHRGDKLSKRDGGLTLASLREAGVAPEQIVGYLAWTLGLIPHLDAVSPAELIPSFDWSRIAKHDLVLPEQVEDVIARAD